MNDTTRVTPEVDAFVDAVRARFSDLDADEREDLLDGLEADMADLVDERGPESLGDPEAYADELRSAAGMSPARRTVRGFGRKVAPVSPTVALGEVRARFDLEVAKRPWAGSALDFLTVIRPAWWVLRAWLLVQAADVLLGPWEELTLLPTLMIPGAGLVLVVLVVVASVQIGRGAWPSERFLPTARRRMALAVGNLVVILLALPLTLSQAGHEAWGSNYGYALASSGTAGVTSAGRRVCNLQAYDVAGQPLIGVQLFDDRGRSFDVRCPDRYGRAAYPWYLGDVARWNVFPLAERRQRTDDRMVDGAYESPRPPAFPVTDRATVPAVTHPLVPVQVEEPAEEPATSTDLPGARSGQGKSGQGKPDQEKSGQAKPGQGKSGEGPERGEPRGRTGPRR